MLLQENLNVWLYQSNNVGNLLCNESPPIYSQCCCKKILMFGYISLTNLYDEHLILLGLIFFNIDNLIHIY